MAATTVGRGGGAKARRAVVSVVGARPQFVKLAALAPALARRFRHVIIHTGQHYDRNMSDVFFRQLHIPRADINLGVGGGSHGAMTGQMLAALERELVSLAPDMVLVYGDTNTTLAGALAAAKLGLPVGHIEAGMRSFVDTMPEEINRRLTDHVASLLFCPTPTAVRQARAESVRGRVVLSGDLMYELLHDRLASLRGNLGALRRHGVESGKYYLLTVHRAGTADDADNLEKLVEIMTALDRPVLFPVHPRTGKMFRRFRLQSRVRRLRHVRLVEPLGYVDTLTLARHARAVLTDSGGLQKEAVFLRTPVLTLREETEWGETLRKGNRLVGLDVDRVVRTLRHEISTRPTSFRVKGKRPSEIVAGAIGRWPAER